MKHLITARTTRPQETDKFNSTGLPSRCISFLFLITLFVAPPLSVAEPIRIITTTATRPVKPNVVLPTIKLNQRPSVPSNHSTITSIRAITTPRLGQSPQQNVQQKIIVKQVAATENLTLQEPTSSSRTPASQSASPPPTPQPVEQNTFPLLESPLHQPSPLSVPKTSPRIPAPAPVPGQDAVIIGTTSDTATSTTQQDDAFPILIAQDRSRLATRTMIAILDCGSPDCQDAATRLKPTPLSDISLDIAPSFKPNLDDKPPKLQAESREWTDRKGSVITEGKLANYAFSKIEIQLKDGTTVKIAMNELSVDDACYVADIWGFPKQCRIDKTAYESRLWTPITFTWKASALAHKPLYFEDVQLERYGHTLGPWIQPARSGAHFFLNIAVLPYRMGIHPWNECQYSLGYYRPGSLAPRQIPAFPINKKAGLLQAGAVIGGVYLIP